MLSRISAPPICISVVTLGVSQRTIGRPEAFRDTLALPGSLRSTNRFIRATRAEGVMRENASLLCAVRYRVKSFELWEQAAARMSLSVPPGPVSIASAQGALPVLALVSAL